MKRETVLTHEFVEFIPNELKDGTIYVSTAYATVAHRCCCGCGREVITPLSPTDWKLIFDGESISLDPSIGNWNFPCRSHYWIERNRVNWARLWLQEEIDVGRAYDSLVKEKYYGDARTPAAHRATAGGGDQAEGRQKESLWQKLKKWLP
jgi:hypothetical protein